MLGLARVALAVIVRRLLGRKFAGADIAFWPALALPAAMTVWFGGGRWRRC